MRSIRVSFFSVLLLAACAPEAPEDPPCVPDCAGRECGVDPRCGTSCGGCTLGACVAGRCEGTEPCTPSCTGLECGADPVCGASCGTCASGTCQAGRCTMPPLECTPACAASERCVDGRCVPLASTGLCEETCRYSRDGECDDGGEGSDTDACEYGTDCADCGERAGLCRETCIYAGDGECDDGGEGSDTDACEYGTDCADCGARRPEGPSCECGDRVCGDDGCGGSCGTCPAGQSCSTLGLCVSGCTPSCAGRECGSDGCGGSCGRCDGDETCNDAGLCERDCFFEQQEYTVSASSVSWSQTVVVSVRLRQRRGDGTWSDWASLVFSGPGSMSRSFSNACDPDVEIERSYMMEGGASCEFGPERVMRNAITIPAATITGRTCTAPSL